jgi:hypothetical protein
MDMGRARELAATAGLEKLNEKQLAQLANGIASAREAADALPKDLHWSEESSLIFRFPLPKGPVR